VLGLGYPQPKVHTTHHSLRVMILSQFSHGVAAASLPEATTSWHPSNSRNVRLRTLDDIIIDDHHHSICHHFPPSRSGIMSSPSKRRKAGSPRGFANGKPIVIAGDSDSDDDNMSASSSSSSASSSFASSSSDVHADAEGTAAAAAAWARQNKPRNVMGPPPDKNTIRICITTDNHVGHLEDDIIRRDDSYRALEEILQVRPARKAACICIR
jgi:hypothetical protein